MITCKNCRFCVDAMCHLNPRPYGSVLPDHFCGQGKPQKQRTSTKPLDERKTAFKSELQGYINDYEREMLIEFGRYWTEHNGRQMRYEKQPVFEMGKRLATWAKNYKPKIQKVQYHKDTTGKPYGYCADCGKSITFDERDIGRDSLCCGAEILPEKP